MSLFHVLGPCLILILALPLHCEPVEPIESLLGKQYVELPEKLCKGYSETLLGAVGTKEYAGLICEQPYQSYLVLQRLVGQTPKGQAIAQIVAIKPLPQLNEGEFSVNLGCVEQERGSRAIFAIVKDSGAPTYQVLRAWEANLVTEKFEELNPQVVKCSNTLLQLQKEPESADSSQP